MVQYHDDLTFAMMDERIAFRHAVGNDEKKRNGEMSENSVITNSGSKSR